MFEGLFQPMHLLLILGIALLFFGPKRLPELGKGLGTSIRDFRDAMSGHGGQKPDDPANSQLEAPKAASGVVGTPLPTPAAQAAPAPPATAAPASPAQAAPPQGPEGGTRA
ncbi:MAG TPA: twin-arginine translocase TatA/TatE family subunit [Thermoanaerobaculia bacterium]|nr:twin-arginine translocase TatA/TatE family subunit [Thermoanaerobaculia bacterium]